MKIIQRIKRIFFRDSNDGQNSWVITNSAYIKRFTINPDFPFLVSFPRTGSHWLRMMMELYFERPSLVRVFYYPTKKDYLSLHTHDMKLDIFRKNVIYLYRDPLPTVYSQMMYEKENIHDVKRIKYWVSLYGKHLCKWLSEEQMSKKKTIIRYENMQHDIFKEFVKLTDHFGMKLDSAKLNDVSAMITKDRVKSKTTHDQQVVNLSKQYSEKRDEFIQNNNDLVWSSLFAINADLGKYFYG